MSILIKSNKEYLTVVKDSKKELKQLKRNSIYIFLFFSCFNIYFIINLYLKGDIIGMLITAIVGEIICYIPIKSIYNQIKYKYCDEILLLSLEKIELKYILESKLLFSKNINYKDIKNIYIKIDNRISFLRKRTKKADNIVLSEYFENIRSLKIKTYLYEIYSWGSEVKEEEVSKILLAINNHIKNIKEY